MTIHPGIPPAYLNTVTVTDALAGLRSLPDASIPLFVFSPPYNLGNSTGGGIAAYRSVNGSLAERGGRGHRGVCRWAGGDLANGYGDFDDNMPHEEYVAQQQAVLTECWRCLTSTGAIFYNHKPRVLGGRLVAPVDYVPSELKTAIRQEIIWLRAGGVNATPAFYMSTHERIVIIARPAWRLRDQSASAVGDTWRIPQEAGTWHPAPFPLGLPLRVLETTGATLVCDPFCGSGTTGRAARMVGAAFVGFDRNADYVARANADIALVQPLPLPMRQAALWDAA